MNALLRSSAIIVLTGGAIAFTNEAASAQTVIRVDIVNGSANPSGVGGGWGADAYKFLQDALDRADFLEPDEENPVDIWVASACCLVWHRPWYRPDQRASHGPNGDCYPYGDCDRAATFDLRDNVHIYGGFPHNPHLWNGGQGATFADRDPVAYPTVLSGDLERNDDFQVHKVIVEDVVVSLGFTFDNYEDNSQHVVTARLVGSNAVLDGFIIQGGIELRGARPLFRDCVIALHEGAAVRCIGGSHVMFHRCTFTGTDCDAIIVDEGSRLELLGCEPAMALAEAQVTGKARVDSCSILLVVDQAGDS